MLKPYKILLKVTPMERPETARPAVTSLVTGIYEERPGYSTWRSRGTDDYLLIYTRSGEARIAAGGRDLRVTEGDMALIRPGAPHDYGTWRGASHWHLVWAHFHPRPHWLDWLNWPEAAPGIHLLRLPEGTARDAASARFAGAHQYTQSGRRHASAFAMNALEETLLLCDAVNPLSEQEALDARVRLAMEQMYRRLGQPVTVRDLAAQCGLSESRLTHLFQRELGVPPMRCLERLRMERARELLELTSRTVQAIAGDLGYENAFYFSARFRAYAGTSPSEYRRRRGPASRSFGHEEPAGSPGEIR